MARGPVQVPQGWREWLIAIAVVLAVFAVLIGAYQPFTDRGEDECRSKCAAEGAKDYSYGARGGCRCITK